MTDEHRRESDPRIDLILSNQESHMTHFHANLSAGEALQYIKRVDQMERGFEVLYTTNKRMLVILDGEEKLNASGEIKRVGGVSNDVAELKVAMNGGKLGIKLTDKILVGLIAAAPSLLLYLTTVASSR